jgi:hypothetical protein
MEELISFVNYSHNPALVCPKAAPNGNIVYHIYSNGEITYQKGGDAYLNRSEYTDSCAYLKKNYYELFPMKINKQLSYAIVTKENAKQIQSMLLKIDSN